MKKTITQLAIFCTLFGPLSLVAQGALDAPWEAQLPVEVATGLRQWQKIQQTQGSLDLRLDSTLNWSVQNGQEVLTIRTVYTYSGDSVIFYSYSLDPLGATVSTYRSILLYDAQGYETAFIYGPVSGGVFNVSQTRVTYRNATTPSKVDSIVRYAPSGINNLLYRSNFTHLTYDSVFSDLVAQELEESYQPDGATQDKRLFKYKYNPDKRRSEIADYRYSGSGDLYYWDWDTYVYTNDTVTIVKGRFFTSSFGLVSKTVDLIEPGTFDSPRRRYYYERNPALQAWLIANETMWELDAQKNIVRQEGYSYTYDSDTLESTYGWALNISYVQDDLLDHFETYYLSNGNWYQTSQYRYYYSQISGNHQAEELEEKVCIFPNPAIDQTFITTPAVMSQAKILDASGNTVRTFSSIDSTVLTIDRKGLASGLYFLQLQFGDKVVGKKIVWN
jgi:hypothetical protein